ncbi:MAG: TRAP transporter substrate-binding protein [Desulfobulbia bacterium]
MKKLQTLILVTLVFILSSSAYAINLRFNVQYNNKHPLSKGVFAPWAKQVKEVTDGRVKVTLFYSNALFKPKDALNAVSKRVADIGVVLPTYTRDRLMMASVLDQPMMTGGKTSDNSEVAWQLLQEIPEIKEEMKDVKVLWAYMNPTFQLHFSKTKPDSLDGLKNSVLSGGGTSMTRILRALGASPESMPMNDVFLAMQKGVIDGCLLPYAPLKSQKIASLLNHHINADLMAITFYVSINKEAWAKISAEDQKAIEAISGVVASRHTGEIFDKATVKGVEYMKEKGDTFVDLTAEQKTMWAEKIQPLRQKWIEEAKAKGYKNPEKVLDRAMQLIAEKSK